MEEIWRFYESYSQDVYRYLISLCRDVQIAEELHSETFLAAILALPHYRGDGDIKAWLFSIARNKWIDHLRKKRGDLPLDGLILEDTAPELVDQFFQKQVLQRIQELLLEEDSRTQMVARMRWQGYSFYEIGKALGIREGSARVIEFRVRKKLREQLKKEGWYDELSV